MKFVTATSLAMLASASLIAIESPAVAGGWGHGPSLSQTRRFTNDTFKQVVIPVITGTINAAGAGAANSAKDGGGELDQGPSPSAQGEATPSTADASASSDPKDDDATIMPPLIQLQNPWLESLKYGTEMPGEPQGPTIGRARKP
ncbi:hypothetical protein R1538_05465 [Rhizobium leguminosarum]|uniref:hypothetical protein n=1 Tax=Rhizobium leguminosarum TaxID=384 RepID=UPI00293DB063|nr:hypothetical protein [Rhizobium leguminosarum]MDV4160568.1 hypothetical protein [Rhizobium leguminosarum]MDV4170297.1 hypothetical protein [Rhizobium leguminosarum]